ncbi:MAG: DUF4097 family beta strand repeat-containing protein [Bacteroides sp.]|nr:DUF4097 family beta strand repeat-containing protein [Bacteroides sp.]
MKKRVSNLRSLLLLLPITIVSFSLNAQDAVKEFSESFEVSEGITLSADIRYTDLRMVSWDKNEVEIFVEIEVDASSKSKAEAQLSKIDVRIGKSGNIISLKTELDDGWSRNAKVNINIIVNAPAYMNLDMSTSYGDLYVQELNGLVDLNMKYGNLQAGTLGRGNEKPFNSLDLAYSDAIIESAGWMELELAYSDMEVENSTMIFCESKYSKLIGKKSGGIITEGAYDKYVFEEVDNFVGELRYSGVKLEALNKKLDVESKYTHVKVFNVSRDFKSISTTTSYGNIYLKMEEGASFKLDGEARYGNFNMALEGKLSKVKENNEVRIWGTVGTAPKGSITLDARYGNIDIE